MSVDPRSEGRKGSRWKRRLLVLLTLLIIGWFGRFIVLRAVGSFLINADTECQADAMYVLGGAPYDRGTEASRMLQEGCAPIAYCTGSSIMQSNKAEGRMITEADLTRTAAIRCGTPAATILPLPFGTSTYEEALGILLHARSKGWRTIVVVTTDFHTRRVRRVFDARFKGSGINVLVHAAPSTEYNVDAWWNSEQGLLMVNNEYVKSLYYLLKH